MLKLSKDNLFYRLSKNLRIAIIIFALALVWLLSGVIAGGGGNGEGQSETTGVQRSDKAFTVRARHSQAVSVPEIISLRGKTLANRDVMLRAELSGRVAETPVVRGQQVKAGDVVCRLNPEDRLLRLREAQASLTQAKLEYEGAKRLKRGGYQSDTAIASAKAKQEKAQAELERRKLDVENLAISAPFDGVVDELPAEAGDWLRGGDVCARLLELTPLLVTAQASESQALKLAVGQPARIQLSDGSESVGQVSFVGQGADSVTRTFTIEVTLANINQWRSGLSARLFVPVEQHQGHLLSPALLALDDQGGLGLRTLDGDRRVQWQSIQLLSDTGAGVWVTGLPEKVDLITVGQEYVARGQQVDVVWEQEAIADSSQEVAPGVDPGSVLNSSSAPESVEVTVDVSAASDEIISDSNSNSEKTAEAL
ncbi:MAG: efflux RND transporter periplasmic adaptor subunit [Cellvibrionaceae bacterium]